MVRGGREEPDQSIKLTTEIARAIGVVMGISGVLNRRFTML